MSALGRPQDMFSDASIQLNPIFAQWVQQIHNISPSLTASSSLFPTSPVWGGDVISIGDKIAMMSIPLGTADFMVFWTLIILYAGNI